MKPTLIHISTSIILAIAASYLIVILLARPALLGAFETHAIAAVAAIILTQLVNKYFSSVVAALKTIRPAASAGRQQGEVKWFNGNKGFGFIAYGNDNEIFVHFRSLQNGSRRLSPGKPVEFTIGEGKKGPEAFDVLVVER